MSDSQCISIGRSPMLRASLVCLTVNLLLAAVKLTCGILCAAPALISDAAHSASDLCSTVIVLIGIRLSAKIADERHPYGHARFESIASILLSMILFAVGVGIGYGSLHSIRTGAYLDAAVPTAPALAVALLAIGLKLALFRYLRTVAEKTHSTALRADAVHQISDALASLGALLGIASAMMGFSILDPLASLLIALFLFRAAVRIFKDSTRALVDRSADAETEAALRTAIEASAGVDAIGRLRTRTAGALLFVEAEILLDRSLPLAECDRVAHAVKTRLLGETERIADCVIVIRGNPPL